MARYAILVSLVVAAVVMLLPTGAASEAQAAGQGQPTDWERFYYYPYVYYPHNFQRPQGSFDHLYYRYSPNQRIPVYNKNWYNFYPTERPYYKGKHFIMDVF